ncbi:exosome nuclease subunit [Coemansia sp. RSA 1933]|nr:exosome nuclease subunit [Coemansia sp. RSA 1933]
MTTTKGSSDFVANFDSNIAAAYAALMKATKAANRLPSDIGFHRTLDEQVDSKVERATQITLEMANKLWRNTYSEEPGMEAIESVDDIAAKDTEDRWVIGPGFRAIVDSIDTLLEKIDVGIDEVLKNPAHLIRTAATSQMGEHSAPLVTSVAAAGGRKTNLALVHAKNTPRPQLLFKDTIDNSYGTPFTWRIREKPHAKVSLDQVARQAAEDIEHPGLLPHPYEYEIRTLDQPSRHFEQGQPQLPGDWDATPFEFVETLEQLQAMMEHLETAGEIAIDLEHHNYRSFQGFTCLVQISTRSRDYVVDAIAVREWLDCLNRVTADPQKIKVFHGAESDILWLQRDFGVYVVGLFDTYHASKVLNMAHHSLAHLLREYCAFTADKKYQLADWRIRPLPVEMVAYARADTHYLLYVYDRLRNELLGRGEALVGQDVGTPGTAAFGQLGGIDVVQSALQPMELTLMRSSQTSLRTYTKDSYDTDTGLGAGGWATLLRKWRTPFAPTQMAVFRSLHSWRDACAREEDESTRYVLPNHMLFVVAERMPTEVPALLALCRPTPPLVRLHGSDIVRLVTQARTEAEARLGDIRALVDEELDNHLPRPVHTRFDDTVDEDTMQVDSQVPLDVDGDVLSHALLASVDALMAPKSALFGSSVHSSIHREELSGLDTAASVRAREIRSALVLTMAVPKTIVTATSHEVKEQVVKLVEKSAEKQSAGTAAAAAPIVISETYGRQKPVVVQRELSADGHAAKKQRVGDLDLSKIALGDIDDDDDHEPSISVKGKKNKKKKNGSRRVDPADVQAFDYGVAGQNSTADAIGKTRQPGGPKKKKQKRNDPGDDKFDPYGNVGELNGLDRRPKKPKSKSGNRTMSYKR